MKNYLPNVSALEPIRDTRKTFCDTPFVNEITKLSELDQLQIFTDIVRQTILYNRYPNPKADTQVLVGNDYTSSRVFMNYLRDTGAFDDYRLAIVSNRSGIDDGIYTSTHFVVLVKGHTGKTYVIDTTPGIGYGYGKAQLSEDNMYQSFEIVTNSMREKLDNIYYDMYEIKHGRYTEEQITRYKSYRSLFNRSELAGLFKEYYKVVMESKFIKLMNLITEDYFDYTLVLEALEEENDEHVKATISTWQEELDILNKFDGNLKRKQELAQAIKKETGNSVFAMTDGKYTSAEYMNPRFMWENGYNVIVIKPSSYLVGISASNREFMIPDRSKLITSYEANLGEPTESGLKPMAYFHPHGQKYEIQMTGPNDVLLVQDNATDLNDRKHIIRSTRAQVIDGHYVTWFNGEKVKWDPDLYTNLVHTTDDACEASIHFLAEYPEYQSFTRFNYPNPVLRKEKKR